MPKQPRLPQNYGELRTLTDDQAIEVFDHALGQSSLALNLLHQELVFRETGKQTEVMVSMTRQMRNMTVVITVATLVNVLLFFLLKPT